MKKIYILLAILLIMVVTGCSGDNATTSATERSSLAASQAEGSTSAITPVDGSGCIIDYANHQIYGLATGIK